MTLSETKYGWDVSHNMIFVDQPINTGFSYSSDPRDRVHDEATVAEDMLDFLQHFFEAGVPLPPAYMLVAMAACLPAS